MRCFPALTAARGTRNVAGVKADEMFPPPRRDNLRAKALRGMAAGAIVAAVSLWLLFTVSGCAMLGGVKARQLRADEYQRLRQSADFAPAWAQTAARPWMLDALKTLNRLQAERDLRDAGPTAAAQP